MSFDGLLIDLATIKRQGSTKDKYGNVEKTYSTLTTGIACRLAINSALENDVDRNTNTQAGVVFTRNSTIIAEDILEIDGLTWLVIGEPIVKQDSKNNHHYEINVEKRTL